MAFPNVMPHAAWRKAASSRIHPAEFFSGGRHLFASGTMHFRTARVRCDPEVDATCFYVFGGGKGDPVSK